MRDVDRGKTERGRERERDTDRERERGRGRETEMTGREARQSEVLGKCASTC